MKKNIATILLTMVLVILMPMFTGCPDDYTGFKNYKPNTKQVSSTAGVVDISVDFVVPKEYQNGGYILTLHGIPNDFETTGGYIKGGSIGVCNNVSDYIEGGVITVGASFTAKKMTGKRFYFELELFSEVEGDKFLTCISESLVGTYKSAAFDIVKEITPPSELDDVIEAIGGAKNYCNIDGNGNYNVLNNNTNNLFTKVAYSQVGPCAPKHCTFCSTGLNDGLKFLNWVAKKSGTSIPWKSVGDDFDKTMKWAKENNRYFTDVSKLNIGDVMIRNTARYNFLGEKLEDTSDYAIFVGYTTSSTYPYIFVSSAIMNKWGDIDIVAKDTPSAEYFRSQSNKESKFKTEGFFINMKGISY